MIPPVNETAAANKNKVKRTREVKIRGVRATKNEDIHTLRLAFQPDHQKGIDTTILAINKATVIFHEKNRKTNNIPLCSRTIGQAAFPPIKVKVLLLSQRNGVIHQRGRREQGFVHR